MTSHSPNHSEATSVAAGSAITRMWAWGNSVPEQADERGLGQPELRPSVVSAFAASRSLSRVLLSIPWNADRGDAIRTWVSGTAGAIRARGIGVSALGGDLRWTTHPDLASQWMSAACAVASFNALELDVEPWTVPGWETDGARIERFERMLAVAQATSHALGLRMGAALPWWLAGTPHGSGSILDAVLPYLDTVSIFAFSDHASGGDGIIALSRPAAQRISDAGKSFTIGVETDDPKVAGGARYTFFEEGAAVLEAEAALVRNALRTLPGYAGVSVQHYRSWRVLKP